MSKFYVGQRVLVTGSTYFPVSGSIRMVNTVGIIEELFGPEGAISVRRQDKLDRAWFFSSDLQPITETPEALTINGVAYIRKPEPVVEHEWKFGDVATHEKHGVGIVAKTLDKDGDLYFVYCDGKNSDFVKPSSLTFIRRADLSV